MRLTGIFAAAALGLAAMSAQATILRIEDSGVGTGSFIPAGFGDSPPVTLNWDPLANSGTAISRGDGYSGGAAGICQSGTGCAIDLLIAQSPPALFGVVLESFFLASQGGVDRSIAYSVTDLATNTIIASGNPLVTAATGLTVSLFAVSDTGLRLSFGPDGNGGGINDITYVVVIGDPFPIPGPASLALFAVALAGFAGIRLGHSGRGAMEGVGFEPT